MLAICYFECAIANMAFTPLGRMVSADATVATVDYRLWLCQNLIPGPHPSHVVILGTIRVVRGGLIVGGAEYFLFNWTKVPRDKRLDLLQPPGQKSPIIEPIFSRRLDTFLTAFQPHLFGALLMPKVLA